MWTSTEYLILGIIAFAMLVLWYVLTSRRQWPWSKPRPSVMTREDADEPPKPEPSTVLSQQWRTDDGRPPQKKHWLSSLGWGLAMGVAVVLVVCGIWVVTLVALIRGGGVESVPIIGFVLTTTALVGGVSILVARLTDK